MMMPDLAGEIDDWELLLVLRRCVLLVSTWLAAHIFSLLHDIAFAARMQFVSDGTPVPKGDGEATEMGTVDVKARPSLQAGFSCPEVPAGTADAEHSWAKLGAEHFKVRCGPNYPKNGFKMPSGPAMGEVVAVDILRTETKLFNLLSLNHIELPTPTPGWSEAYPEFFVINQMLPGKFCNSFMTSRTKTDGETFNLIVYVRLQPKLARDWTDDQEPKSAEELLKRFLLRADQDPAIAQCFKEIGVIRNLESLGAQLPSSLTSIMKKFNGKPVLTRPEHYFHRDPHNRYFMCDLDGHCYQYLTRSAMAKGMSYVDLMHLGYGYVVEARKEAEMPEKMVCSCEIFRMSEKKAVWFPPSKRKQIEKQKEHR